MFTPIELDTIRGHKEAPDLGRSGSINGELSSSHHRNGVGTTSPPMTPSHPCPSESNTARNGLLMDAGRRDKRLRGKSLGSWVGPEERGHAHGNSRGHDDPARVRGRDRIISGIATSFAIGAGTGRRWLWASRRHCPKWPATVLGPIGWDSRIQTKGSGRGRNHRCLLTGPNAYGLWGHRS